MAVAFANDGKRVYASERGGNVLVLGAEKLDLVDTLAAGVAAVSRAAVCDGRRRAATAATEPTMTNRATSNSMIRKGSPPAVDDIQPDTTAGPRR